MDLKSPTGLADLSLCEFGVSEIVLSQIDLSDQTYRITRAEEELSALALSISRLGICTPPAVIECRRPASGQYGNGSEKAYVIVSGFRRIRAAASVNLDKTVCRVFSESAHKSCACLAVAENAHARDLGPGELVRAVGLLAGQMNAKTISGQSQSLFNLNLNAQYVNTLLKIFLLGPEAVDLLDQGLLAIKAAKLLTECPPEDAQAFIRLFSQIKASTGKQVEILTWTREIAAREETTMDSVLSEQTLQSILDGDQKNRDAGAAANRVRAWIFARRFPELDTVRKQSAKLVRELKLPANIRMAVPENFESMVYGLTLNITSLGELDRGIQDLSLLKTHPSFKQILDR